MAFLSRYGLIPRPEWQIGLGAQVLKTVFRLCYKCYFQGVREGEGYLVCWRRSPLIQLSKAWAFAEELRVDFGVGHLMRGAPFLAALTREQANLNARMRKVLGDRTLTLALMGP